MAALRKSTAVVGQTLYVTVPSGIGRAHEVLIGFEVRIRHVQPTALGVEYQKKRKERRRYFSHLVTM